MILDETTKLKILNNCKTFFEQEALKVLWRIAEALEKK